MPKILVYAEQSGGKPAAIALEILTKARDLGDAEAVTLGAGAESAAAVLGKHGARTVYVNEDGAFDEYLAEPQTDALEALVQKASPDLLLFGFTPDSREVAGRLAARLDVGLISNAQDVQAMGGGFSAKVPYFGGARVAMQHTVGMKRAKVIIAINKGAEAPIMKIADLGVVGDALKIVPKLTEAVKAKKAG